jgi:hypothetical protein
VPQTTQVSLCVQVSPAKADSERGHSAQWTVSAWTTGGNVPDAAIRLQATPASGGMPGFSFGCGKDDGTSACDLGAVDAKSAKRQLRAQVTVPVTASGVKSVKLTAVTSAAGLTKALKASSTVSITAPATSAGAPQNPADSPPVPADEPQVPAVVTSPLPVGSLPSISAVSPTLSPAGNAAGLFPTLNPQRAKGSPPPDSKARTRPVADNSALPEGAPVINAQLAGLAALALAFVLAVTRLSIRRRPKDSAAPKEQGNGTPQEPDANNDK